MAKRTLTISNLLGPGVVPGGAPSHGFVEVSAAYRFDDGDSVNWPVPVRFTFTDGVVVIPNMEDTYLGEALVWAFKVTFRDSRGREIFCAPSYNTFPAGVGPVAFTDLIAVDTVVLPEFGPSWAAQAALSAQQAAQSAIDAAANGGATDAAVADRITNGTATQAALSATFDSLDAFRARTARATPPRWSQESGLAPLVSSGLTIAGAYVAATVAGTIGDAILPIWGSRNDLRASFVVKATKSIAGSRSTVGFTVSAIGALPTGTGATTAGAYGIGYVQGVGFGIVRDNVGPTIVLLADTAITDGTEYTIALHAESTTSKLFGVANGTVGAIIYDAAGTVVAQGNTTFSHAFYAPRNALIRTNVGAGALSKIELALHPLASVKASSGYQASTSATESAFFHVPAVPNGKVVYAFHGHGGTDYETGWQSPSYRPTWLALAAAGYLVVVPKMGGNLWGNDDALAGVVDLHELLVRTFDIEPAIAYLWGNSMGGGAAATVIAKKLLPIRAAYLAEPAVNYDAIKATGSYPTLDTAYPTLAEMDDNNPLKQSSAAYDVPLFITSSAADTAIPKTQNADQLVALVGSSALIRSVTVTGNHGDPSHFRANDTVRWFQSFN